MFSTISGGFVRYIDKLVRVSTASLALPFSIITGVKWILIEFPFGTFAGKSVVDGILINPFYGRNPSSTICNLKKELIFEKNE